MIVLAKFTDEQCTTGNQSRAGRFDLRLFVNNTIQYNHVDAVESNSCVHTSIVDRDPQVETSCP